MLSTDVAATFLHERFGRNVADVTPIAHGEWSRAFTFDRGAEAYVICFSALNEDFHKDRLAGCYGAVSASLLLSQVGLPRMSPTLRDQARERLTEALALVRRL